MRFDVISESILVITEPLIRHEKQKSIFTGRTVYTHRGDRISHRLVPALSFLSSPKLEDEVLEFLFAEGQNGASIISELVRNKRVICVTPGDTYEETLDSFRSFSLFANKTPNTVPGREALKSVEDPSTVNLALATLHFPRDDFPRAVLKVGNQLDIPLEYAAQLALFQVSDLILSRQAIFQRAEHRLASSRLPEVFLYSLSAILRFLQ